MVIRISGTLLRYTDYRKEVSIVAATVREAVMKLVETFPDLRKVLLTREGALRATHRLFLNGELVPQGAWERSADADAELDVMTAVAGG